MVLMLVSTFTGNQKYYLINSLNNEHDQSDDTRLFLAIDILFQLRYDGYVWVRILINIFFTLNESYLADKNNIITYDKKYQHHMKCNSKKFSIMIQYILHQVIFATDSVILQCHETNDIVKNKKFSYHKKFFIIKTYWFRNCDCAFLCFSKGAVDIHFHGTHNYEIMSPLTSYQWGLCCKFSKCLVFWRLQSCLFCYFRDFSHISSRNRDYTNRNHQKYHSNAKKTWNE